MTLYREQQIIYRASTMARTIDHRVGGDARLRTIFTGHSRNFIPTTDNGLDACHARLERAVPTAIFKVTVQIRHQRVAVHYTGSLALDDTRFGSNVGFSGGRFGGTDEPSRGVA